MNIKRILGIVLASAIVISAFAGCGSEASSSSAGQSSAGTSAADVKETNDNDAEGSQTLRDLRVAVMTGQPDQYTTYIGQQQGIYEKYGINLTTTEHVAGINTIDAVVNGTADTGEMADFAAVNRIGNTLHDTNLVFFSEEYASTPRLGGLYVAPEFADDLSKLDGSKGWITQIGTVVEYFNWQSQTYIGLDPEKQNIVQTDSNQTSLALAQNGDASAVVATGATGSYYENLGWKLAATSEEIGIDLGGYLLTTKEFLSDNTDLLADYLKGFQESIDYINDNIDTVATDVEAKFGVKADDFKANWKNQTFRVGFTEEGAAHLDEINAWAFEHERFSEEYNIRDFIDTSAAEKAVPDNVTIKK